MNQPMSKPIGMHVLGRPGVMRTHILDGVDRVLAALTGLLAMVVYLRTLAPGVLGGDSGEFQFTAWLGGFAHPTGYPLYLILGYLWTHLLPWHDPAWRLNLFSALCGAFAVALTYLLAAAILHRTLRPGQGVIARRLLAVLAALSFAFTSTFWSQALVAEVYALNAVFVVAVLLGLVIWSEQAANGVVGRSRTLYWTAAVYGLGLAHHRTMILLVPAVALFLWYGRGLQRAMAAARGQLQPRPALFVSPTAALPLHPSASAPGTLCSGGDRSTSDAVPLPGRSAWFPGLCNGPGFWWGNLHSRHCA